MFSIEFVRIFLHVYALITAMHLFAGDCEPATPKYAQANHVYIILSNSNCKGELRIPKALFNS